MKLIFSIKSLSQLGGGAERVFVDVVNGLQGRGHEVSVLTFEQATARSFYRLSENIPRLDIAATTSRKAEQLLALPRTRSTIVDHGPDAVVAFMPSCYVPLGIALAFSDIPFVASEHNVPARYRQQPYRWLSILSSSLYARRFTGVTAQMRQLYPNPIRRKMTVVPNPITVPPGSRADVVGKPGEKRRILAVGRLHEQKDHASLIHAFATLAKDFPDWTLRILGDGPERGRLASLIDRHGIGHQVFLARTVQDIGPEYQAAQLYVVPSHYESLGLATIEALAHGLPAIGFADCPGTNELIVDRINGLLVTRGNDRVASLAKALRQSMQDDQLRLDLAMGATDIPSHYALNHVLDRWEKLLQDVVRN